MHVGHICFLAFLKLRAINTLEICDQPRGKDAPEYRDSIFFGHMSNF